MAYRTYTDAHRAMIAAAKAAKGRRGFAVVKAEGEPKPFLVVPVVAVAMPGSFSERLPLVPNAFTAMVPGGDA